MLNAIASIAQIAQLPLVLFICLLCYKAIKMLNLNQFLWVSLAFASNFIYIVLTFLADEKSPLYPMLDLDIAFVRKASLILNILTSFFFYLGFLLWFTFREPHKVFGKSLGQKLATIFHIILGSRTRALYQLLFLTAIVMLVALKTNFNINDPIMNWSSTLYSIGGLLSATFLFRWNSGRYIAARYSTIGFVLWTILQLLIPLNSLLDENVTTPVGFSVSLIAKFFILTSIFLWCVDFTGETQRKIERDQQEKEQFEKSSKHFKEILSSTFHEITGPLKDLETSIQSMSNNLPRAFRLLKDNMESNYERVQAVVTVSKYSFNQEGNYNEDLSSKTNISITNTKIININTLIEAAANSVKNYYKPLYIDIRKDFSANCYVECNQSEIIQVFRNLFKNSIEAYGNNDAKKIQVKTYSSKDNDDESLSYVVVEVEDYANGIPEDIQEFIWNQDYSTKPKDAKETIRGQGLYVVKEIIAKHMHSLIALESPIRKGEGNNIPGSKFTLKLLKYELQ